MDQQVLDIIKGFEDRIKELEYANDCSLFTNYMGRLSRPDVYRCIEMGVCEYFNISYSTFYDNLLIGNKTGSRRYTVKALPTDPSNITDEYERMLVARQCLFGILHVDFHVTIPALKDFYNTNPATYIDKWRERYIRIFNGQMVAGDEIYKMYWQGIFKKCVEVSEREGLYDRLIEGLTREGLIYNRLKKWRIA